MNKDRRERIAVVLEELSRQVELLTELHDEESDAFENMPEGLQSSERGQQSETARDKLEEAKTLVEQAVDELGGIE